jgi:molybdopterin-containing oxidoreductase family iron-sulfur binding subunit
MTITRRGFLKLAGVSLVAAGCQGPLDRLQGSAPKGASTLPGPRSIGAGRWAMAIDVSRLQDPAVRMRIADACHRAHNVAQIDSVAHEIKWIWTEKFEHAFAGTTAKHLAERLRDQPTLVLCNHCSNPPCVRVCPTKATYQREDGIVMMDYHRCIGCRFCMAGCPYGSRSFNFWDPRPYIEEINPKYPTRTKGVVEKCDFCVERLAEGLMPICVEESDGAIVFGDLEDETSPVRRALENGHAIQRKPHLGTDPGVYYLIG